MFLQTSSLVIFTFVIILKDQSVDCGAANRWHYRGDLGPSQWPTVFPFCGGRRQSPVDFNKCDVQYDRSLTQFRLHGYADVTDVSTTLENNGHTVEVDLEGRPIAISGAGLPGVYRVKQFHFHWGAADDRGSEHALNGHHFPMEMHVVHYNTRYGTYERAEEQPDGLAVLAFFFQVGRHNPHFEPILSHLNDIRFRGDQVRLQSFPLLSILPSNLVNYYRYRGSLTTPPCFESVIWSIFKTPEEISERQLNEFRFHVGANFPNQTNEQISDDFRPIQPLNGRRITSSDPSDSVVRQRIHSPRRNIVFVRLRNQYRKPRTHLQSRAMAYTIPSSADINVIRQKYQRRNLYTHRRYRGQYK